MGADRVTVRNLKVLRVDAENNLLLVEGAVPGAPEQRRGDSQGGGAPSRVEVGAGRSREEEGQEVAVMTVDVVNQENEKVGVGRPAATRSSAAASRPT